MKGATPEMNLRWGGGFATLGQTPAPATSNEGISITSAVGTENPTHAQ